MPGATPAAVVLVNPRAGSGKPARLLPHVQSAFHAQNFPIQFALPQSREEFKKAARSAISRGAKTLVAMGGDGTLQLLIRETLGCGLTLGVIPAGGGNDFAAALGIENWREAVPAIAHGKSRAVDLARVRFHNGTSAIYIGGGGVGLDAEAAKLASEHFAGWPGRLRYLAGVIRGLYGFAGVEVELQLEGDETPAAKGKFLLVAALNTPSYGGGLRLAPEARIGDGLLDVVVVEKLTAFQVLSLLPRLALRGKLETPRLRRYRGAKVRIHAQCGTLFHGDGEILGPDPCEIAVLTGAIQVLVP